MSTLCNIFHKMYMVSNPRRPYNTVMKFVKYVTKHRAYMLVILIH